MVASDLGAALAHVSRLGSSGDLILRAVENRAALAALEIAEARQRLLAAAIWSAVAAFSLLLAGVATNLVVAAIFWDTPQRVPALIVLAVVQFAFAGAIAWYLRSRWKRWGLFELSRDQLTKDAACLKEIFTQNQS